MNIKISLAGNPNSGKTTMFNALTGSSQRVGNWPGVTVERKEGKLKNDPEIIIQDLPGIYSLSPYTPEEVVARTYLINERPDVIINIVDASNIERNLYLTTQLLELGIPTVIALNMFDVVRKKGISIDLGKLGEKLGCPVIATSAVRKDGCQAAVEKAVSLVNNNYIPRHYFDARTEKALEEIAEIIKDEPKCAANLRWFTVKLLEHDPKTAERLSLSRELTEKIDRVVSALEEELNDSGEGIIAAGRYNYISQLLESVTSRPETTGSAVESDGIDRIVTNRFLAIPIFAAVMFLVYYISITTIGSMGTDWVNDVLFGEWIPDLVNRLLDQAGASPWLRGLIVDGIIAGVGAVLGFLPQMLVLFLCLSVLEDCGYMARVAFIMDRIFRCFGLSGKSFIPMLIGTGCSVPGIMASRTIENESDRRMTVITTSFIPCSAKLPMIALISGALFNDAAWVAASTYLAGTAAVIISGIILKKCRMFSGEVSPFIMELPAYHLPLLSSVVRSTLQRGWSFVKKAGTIVMLSTTVIWVLQNFSWDLRMSDPDNSILASLGSLLAPLFSPLGWGNWQAAVATITGLIAKENVVSTLGVLYGVNEMSGNGLEFWSMLRQDYTRLAAYSFLLFNLLCAPCAAAVGAVKKEMNSARWTFFAIGYQTAFAFIVSLIIYQFGTLFAGLPVSWPGIISASALLVLVIFLIFRRTPGKN